MYDKWDKLPKWLKDTIQVILMMGILLIAYDLVMPQLTHQGYSITTLVSFAFQMLVGFIAVGIYNYFKAKSKAKELARKAELARIERVKKEQQARQHEQNASRNAGKQPTNK